MNEKREDWEFDSSATVEEDDHKEPSHDRQPYRQGVSKKQIERAKDSRHKVELRRNVPAVVDYVSVRCREDWLKRASVEGGAHAYRLAHLLAYMARLEKSSRFRLRTKMLKAWKVSKATRSRHLRVLQDLGLVRILEHGGNNLNGTEDTRATLVELIRFDDVGSDQPLDPIPLKKVH